MTATAVSVVERLLMENVADLEQLAGSPLDADRRSALVRFLVAAYLSGYQDGLADDRRAFVESVIGTRAS